MIYVFEDKQALDLEPLTLTRAAFELRCGAFTHLERIRRLAGNESIALMVRPELAAVVQETFPDLPVNPDTIEAGVWLNGLAVWSQAAIDTLKTDRGRMVTEDRLIGAWLEPDAGQALRGHLLEGAAFDPGQGSAEGPILLRYLWDHFEHNGKQIGEDFKAYFADKVTTRVPAGVYIVGDAGVYLGADVELDPMVVLDASEGPIIIEDGTRVMPQATIEGPCYIGPKCKVWPMSFVGISNLGPVSRVAGQLEEVIIQGYTNKQHDGFLGHAYLGSWVNLGAGTTNSDLKNNYGSVKVSVNGRVVDTGQTFVGCFIGDHSKSAIGTLFYTGTRVGVAANVFGSTTPPKVVPSFAWGGDGKVKYDLDKCLETMGVVKSRRKKEFTESEKELYRRLYGEAY